jgi:peroxisomal coenzyme A diphosphatase NUDT7
MKNDLTDINVKIAGRKPGILRQNNVKDAAVLLPLVYDQGELSILFEVRSFQLKRQPGEICFPGGVIDETDDSPRAAAIRELSEELLVNSDDVHMIADLDLLLTPIRGLIFPFVGHLQTEVSLIKPNLDEVDHIFTVPLSYFYDYQPIKRNMSYHYSPDASNISLNMITNGNTYSKQVITIPQLFYQYESYVIWGLTAQILYHFLEITKPR